MSDTQAIVSEFTVWTEDFADAIELGLSPYLSHGCLSPRRLAAATLEALGEGGVAHQGDTTADEGTWSAEEVKSHPSP